MIAHAAPVGSVDELDEVAEVAEFRQHLQEVADVVAAVAQRRLVDRQQPQAVDAQPLQVVELGREAPQVAGAVAVGIGEPADQHLVEDRALIPERIAALLARAAGLGQRRRGSRDAGSRRVVAHVSLLRLSGRSAVRRRSSAVLHGEDVGRLVEGIKSHVVGLPPLCSEVSVTSSHASNVSPQSSPSEACPGRRSPHGRRADRG